MKTRWMIAGSLLTLGAIIAMVALGGVVLAQRGGDEATPETSATEEGTTQATSWHRDSGFGRIGPFGQRFVGKWHHAEDGDGDPLGHLAEILGISTDELREALAVGQTLTKIAEANGMSRQELVDALMAEVEEHLTLAVEEGFLDQEQVEFIRDWMADGVELLVDHPLLVGEGWWEPGVYEDFHVHPWHDLLDAEDFDLPERLAEVLGLTLQELVEALLDGQTLAEIAEANGAAPQTVVDFLTGEVEAELDEAVAADYVTEEQAQVLRGWVEDGVKLLMDNSFAFPNLFELPERLEERFGTPLEGLDWDKWAEFGWSELIGQDPLSAAAETIGVSRGELLDALSEGQTLAEIAEAHGVDPQVVIDAQTESVTDILDQLSAGGLISDQVSDLVREHLGEGMGMFARRGFPFAGRWGKLHGGWGLWGDEDAPRIKEWMQGWFDCCPCEDAEGAE